MKDLCRSREGAAFASRTAQGECGAERVLRFRAGAARQERVEMGLHEARGRRSLPAAIRVYHTHLDSEDGVDGLFDAREVSLAEGPQHLILADADQGLLRGPDDDDAAAASAAFSAVLRRVRMRHVAHASRRSRRKFSATSFSHSRIRDFACAQTRYTHTRLYCRVLAKRFETMRTIRDSRDSDIFTAVHDCEISIAAREAVFFVLSLFYRSPPTHKTFERAVLAH